MLKSKSFGEQAFVGVNTAVLLLILLVTLYPIWYVVVASFSDPVKLYSGGKLLLWPRGFSMASYGIITRHEMLWRSYGNTVLYVSMSLVVSLLLTVLGSYVLSRRSLPGRNAMLIYITVTMFFSGGLIPTYLVVVTLGLVNTIWAMVLPGAVSTYNLIVMMTYFRGIPASLEESARIDGANDWTILTRIMIPLARPVLAVISLYILVANWNSYVPATIYLRNRDLFPLQVVLREILISGSSNLNAITHGYDDYAAYSESVKYATIIVSTLPILAVYPFLQRFFVKGVMLGAIKG